MMRCTRPNRRRLNGSRCPGGRNVLWALTACLIAFGGAAGSSANDPFLRRTATVRAVQRVGPAVVNITTERIVVRRSPFRSRGADPIFDRFFRDFFEPRTRRQTVRSLGSGVIIDAQGHVLTNDHVVARASRIRLSLADGREFDATLIGADPNNDLAVLRLETEERLPWITLGSSEDLLVGEPVIAIGNPFGLSNSVTTGVLSALDRSINTNGQTFHGFLQTDASINPGNSGGPLLNAEGGLIGINTAIYSGAEGIGFAIPIDVAKRVMAELIEYGEVQPVWLGLEFQDLDPALQEAMDLEEGVFGALVNGVNPDGPAGRAGLRRGDIVQRLDGRRIQTAKTFFEMLGSVTAGQQLQIGVWRDGGVVRAEVRAEEIPQRVIAELSLRLLGVKLSPSPDGRGGFEVKSVRPGSGSAQLGIQPGDLFLGVNGQPLSSEDDLRRAVVKLRGRQRALVVVQRGNGRYHLTIPLV